MPKYSFQSSSNGSVHTHINTRYTLVTKLFQIDYYKPLCLTSKI
jgi:hypothetical protein